MALLDVSKSLDLLRQFALPGGDDAARAVREIRTTQRGQLRASATARWIPFTATEVLAATESRFCWQARIGRTLKTTVIDAYENGHGRLVIRPGGLLSLKTFSGPAFDEGELQRYLASVPSFCPAALLNHPGLEWSDVEPLVLRLSAGPASVEVHLCDDGRPLFSRAVRGRIDGKNVVPTPWVVTATDVTEFDGLRIARRAEAAWLIPGEPFTYFESELTSVAVIR